MNKYIRSLFLLSLLLSSSIVCAENRAVKISLSNDVRYPETLDKAALSKIQQTLGDAVIKGTLRNLITYNHQLAATGSFIACAEVASSAQLDSLVTTLRAVKPKATTSYQLKSILECDKNIELVCLTKPEACFRKEFIESPAYFEYAAKQQFAAGLADILRGKQPLSAKLVKNPDWVLADIAEIGLSSESENCSAITAYASSAEAVIACTLKGNAAINGRLIALHRDIKGVWTCDSDLSDENKLKYAVKCQGTL